MSQFLWIEDFGNVEVDTATASVFGGIVGAQELPTTKYKLRKFIENYGVLLKLDFLEALEFIRNPEQLFRVDYIILDVWLPVDTTKNTTAKTREYLHTLLQRYNADEQTARAQLEKIAGYQLYVELVMEIGFPKEHILFCSNHAEELSFISKAFGEAKLKLPEILTKLREEDIAKVQTWVKERRKNPYYLLRRGIIEGCHYILSQLESRPATEVIKFDQFIEQENASDMQAYLKILQNFLSIRQPEDKQTQYKLFVRTLVHEWDSAVHPDNLPRCNENDDKDCWQARRLNTTFGWILKNARNWITHSTFLDDLSEPEVAFLFIIAMRAMFKLAPTTEKYERMLFSLFNAENPDSMADKIGEPKNYLSPVRIFLAETYSDLKNKIFAENEKGAKVNDAFYFNEMLNNLQNGKVSHDYKRGLFQMFWHGLSPVRLHKNPKDEKVSFVPPKTNMVRTNYSFHYHDYGAQKKGFLFDLACHIYKISF
jgi:hypothetical protein